MEKYYVSISHEANVNYEIEAETEKEAKEKAWKMAIEEIPGAEHEHYSVISESELIKEAQYQEFLEWKKNCGEKTKKI